MIDPGMIKKLQKDLHERIERMTEDLKQKTVEGTAGGGAVTVVANGDLEIVSVRIKAEAIDPDDPEMLQDLVMAASNQALDQARQMKEESVSAITGGLKLPGFF
jgi:nucleoid-associated protein EbfC